MKKVIAERDIEALSAYLDGELSEAERYKLETLLKERSDLRQELHALQHTRALLRTQPRIRAPRRFTLTAEMVGKKKQERAYVFAFSALRAVSLASVALLLVVFVYGFFSTSALTRGMMSAAPAEEGEYPVAKFAEKGVVTEEVQALMVTEEGINLVEATMPAEKPLQETPLSTPELSLMQPAATEPPTPSPTEEMKALAPTEEVLLQDGEPMGVGGGMEQPQRTSPMFAFTPLVIFQVFLGLLAVASAVMAVLFKRKLR